MDDLVMKGSSDLTDRELEFLWGRGVSSGQIAQYHIGYLDRLPDLLYPKDFLDWCWNGRRIQDVFIFPLADALGSVRGLQFRSASRERKVYLDYMPTDGTPMTFGLAQALPHIWETGQVWLVEGVYDLFPIQRIHPNVIPLLTSGLSVAMRRLLRRVATELVVALDMDTAGREGWEGIRSSCSRHFSLRRVEFPRVMALDGVNRVKDPSELWEVWGDVRFREFLDSL